MQLGSPFGRPDLRKVWVPLDPLLLSCALPTTVLPVTPLGPLCFKSRVGRWGGGLHTRTGPGCTPLPPCGGDPNCITTPCTALPAPLNFASGKLCQFLKSSDLFGKAPQRETRDDTGALEGRTHMWWQFWGFGGAHTAGYMGLATTWVPMGAEVPALLPNDHPNPSQGRQKGF